MKKITQISIGIPAYNEENNIQNILRDILVQKQVGWKLKEILIYCDGCSDKTVAKIKEIKSPLIRIFNFSNRKGKTFRLNQMFKQFSGDYLVMYDADICIADKNTTANLLGGFGADRQTVLVSGCPRPFSPNTFFESAVYTTFDIFYQSRKYLRGGNNAFGCTGQILAGTKTFLKNLRLPKIINEDSFIYLTCVSKGYKFKYIDSAVVYYKMPSTVTDYLRQIVRSDPDAVAIELEKYFGDFAISEYSRPISFLIRSAVTVFLKNPLGLLTILVLRIACRPFYKIISTHYKLSWFTAKSTHE